MTPLTEREIQDAYVDDVFADGNREQEYLRRVERGIAYKARMKERDRTLPRTHGAAEGSDPA